MNKHYKITIVEIAMDGDAATDAHEIYTQRVEQLNLIAVIAAINHKPRIRTKKPEAAK